MRKQLLLKTMLLLFALIVGNSTMWGADDEITFSTYYSSVTSGSKDINDETISVGNSTIVFHKVSGNNNPQYYANATAVRVYNKSTITVSSSLDIASIVVTSNNGVPSSSNFTSASDDSDAKMSYDSTNKKATWTGNAKQIVFTVTTTLRITNIAITYSEVSPSYTVTYDGNGNTSGSVPTDGKAYESGATVTVLGNTGDLAKAGYAFDGWNTQADGEGTNYAAAATFNITANTTLYAKWNAKTITGLSYSGTPTKISYSAGENFDPTGLTVTATYSDNSSEDVTSSVAWTPSPLTQGTTSVTGTYMERTITINGLTVTAAAGSTAENPYTVAEAIAAIDAAGKTTINDKYVRGIVSKVDSYNSTYSSITYWISDDGTTTSQFEVYGGLSFDDGTSSFSSKNDVQVGDVVVVKGNITYYSNNKIYEFEANNHLVSLKLVAPTISPATGGVVSGTEVTISDLHTDATIHYTTDGTDPTSSSAEYDSDNKPTITAATTIKAIAVKDGFGNSDVATASFTIILPVETPNITLAGGTYTSVQTTTITCDTEGATIYYTTDGSTPTTSSTEYTGAISISESMTIKAIAAKDGMANSAVADATYTISLPSINAENVNITYDATEGSIAYTITNPAGGTLTASVPGESWVTLGEVGSSAVAFTCAANSETTARTTTVTLTYTYDTDKTVTKDVTITQAKAPATVIDGYFDFTYTDKLDYGTGLQPSGTDIKVAKTFTAGNITLTPEPTANNKSWRWYTGTPNTLRLYTDTKMTIAAPNGYFIKKIDFVGTQNLNAVTVSSGNYTYANDKKSATWTGCAQSVVFTRNGSNPFYTTITVTYEQGPATLTKNVTSAGWATYAPEYPVEFGDEEAYIIEVADDTETVLTKVSSVPAGTPVLLKGAGDHTLTVVGNSDTDVSSNCLKVSDGEAVDDDIYVLANGNYGVGFYLWTGANPLSAGKIYMLPNATSSRGFFSLDGETTGIDASLTNGEVAKGEVYNLNGQRVAQPTKGLYIVNGKKVIIK